MQTALLDYDLPPELIAERPLSERDAARLLVLDRGTITHRRVRDLPELLPERALVVVNDSRVRRARLFGQRRGSGGRVEFLMIARRAERERGDGREAWEALGRASKPLRPGTVVESRGFVAEVREPLGEGTILLDVQAEPDVESLLEREGHVPLPPYLRRPDEADDVERYQTVYAARVGSVAAPTAGLHLSAALLDAMRARGAELGRLELQVGLGTFRPVTADDLSSHVMHAERFAVSEELAAQVAEARRRGSAVVAIGTTAVRALESAADPARPGHVRPMETETRLLIQPGYDFRVVDALLTNFHQPKSTLMALVSAFAGLDAIRAAYREAIAERYRFLSFGDAMWLPRRAS